MLILYIYIYIYIYIYSGQILSVANKITPFRDVKNNTQDWFDDEVAKAIKLREKRVKQLVKSTKLNIIEDLYKVAKYHALKLIKEKKSQFYKEKIK